MWHACHLNKAAEREDHLLCDRAYLQHHRADVSYTLSDGLWSAGDGDSPLCRVRQHVSCHLNLSARGLNVIITMQHKKTNKNSYLLLKTERERTITQIEMLFQAPVNYTEHILTCREQLQAK